MFHWFPFFAIKASFLMSRAWNSIHFRELMFAGWKTLSSKTVYLTSRRSPRASVAADVFYNSSIGLRRRKRRRWGPTDVWYVAVLPHIGFWRFLLLSPVPRTFFSSPRRSRRWRWGIVLRSSESGINRKGDTPPGLITRKFSCHSPRLILGFWRGK